MSTIDNKPESVAENIATDFSIHQHFTDGSEQIVAKEPTINLNIQNHT